jgi:DNA-binding GntR family transcriptional regulator
MRQQDSEPFWVADAAGPVSASAGGPGGWSEDAESFPEATQSHWRGTVRGARRGRGAGGRAAGSRGADGRRRGSSYPADSDQNLRSDWETRTEPADNVLTNRIAATLAHHPPGWLLPRPSVLARRYHVTTKQVAAAIDELVARHLIRILPDGQACRISPAEYMLELEGQQGLAARAEPLHGTLTCKSQSVAWHSVRADIASVLGIAPGESACILQMLWTVGGMPAAATTTYLVEQAAKPLLSALENAELEAFRTILPMPPSQAMFTQPDASAAAQASEPLPGAESDADDDPDDATTESDAFLATALVPSSLHIEMQQPPPWAAKALRLAACDSAIGISVRYTDATAGRPAALTVAVLRPDEFRVIVDSVVTPLPAPSDARNDSPAQRHRATG